MYAYKERSFPHLVACGFLRSDKPDKLTHQHREPSTAWWARGLQCRFLQTEEGKLSNKFSRTRPVILFLPCGDRHSQSHEVPVTLHIWELYFPEKGHSVRGWVSQEQPLLSPLLTKANFPYFLQQLYFPGFMFSDKFQHTLAPRVTTKEIDEISSVPFTFPHPHLVPHPAPHQQGNSDLLHLPVTWVV